MPVENLQKLEWIETMENFIYRLRPEPEIRDKIDLSYKIENRSIRIFEIRPLMGDSSTKIESNIAKTTFVLHKKRWLVYWLRGNLKWYPYTPCPEVKTLKEFLNLVEEDRHHCFLG